MAKRYPTLNDVARLLWPLELDFSSVRRYVSTAAGTPAFVRVAVPEGGGGELIGLLTAARFDWHTGTQQEAPRHFFSIPINSKLEG